MTLDSIRANIGCIENPAVQRAMLVALDHAGTDLQQLQLNLEAWYNSAMDRVSGWYKRSSQFILLLLGLVMAIALNINSMHIGSMLYHDRTERDLMVASAQRASSAPPMNYQAAAADIGDLDALIGWHLGVGAELQQNGGSDAVGWLLTAFAVSFGAPFWFDLLNRLIVIRSTVKPHQKSPEEGSADGAIAATPVVATPAPVIAPVLLADAVQVDAAQPAPSQPDGCDVDMATATTTDEQLPVAAGGVR